MLKHFQQTGQKKKKGRKINTISLKWTANRSFGAMKERKVTLSSPDGHPASAAMTETA